MSRLALLCCLISLVAVVAAAVSSQDIDNVRGAIERKDTELAGRLLRELPVDKDSPADLIAVWGEYYVKVGNPSRAVKMFETALQRYPQESKLWCSYTRATFAANMVNSTIFGAQQCLQIEPENLRILSLLADSQYKLGAWEDVLATFNRISELDPLDSRCRINAAIVLRNLERWQEAMQAAREAVALDPDNIENLFTLGALLNHYGRRYGSEYLLESKSVLERVLEVDPDHIDARANLAASLSDLGDKPAAAGQLAQVIQRRPTFYDAYMKLGIVLKDLGDFPGSLSVYEQVMVNQPHRLDVRINIASTLQEMGRFHNATVTYADVIRMFDRMPQIPDSLGTIMLSNKNDPCWWKDWNARHHYLYQLSRRPKWTRVNAFAAVTLGMEPAFQRHFSRRAVETAFPHVVGQIGVHETVELHKAAANRSPPIPNTVPRVRRLEPGWKASKKSGGILRIGYLSHDFHDHPVCDLFSGVLRLHDRSRVHVIAYSTNYEPAAEKTPCRQAVMAAVDEFVNLSPTYSKPVDSDIANRIRSDGVHVLIDLNGFTGGAHTKTLLLRPAPVQVQVIGYPSSIGSLYIPQANLRFANTPESISEVASFGVFSTDLPQHSNSGDGRNTPRGGHCFSSKDAVTPEGYFDGWTKFPGDLVPVTTTDYSVVDNIIAPEGLRNFYDESLVVMPYHLWPHTHNEINLSGLPSLHEKLSEGDTLVFASFNQPYKLQPTVFDLWGHILSIFPNSIILLAPAEDETRQNLWAEASSRGIAPRRLVFSQQLPKDQHLRRLASTVHVGLDTINYNGGSTTSDLLRAGVPYITTPADGLTSRMASSMAIASGIPDFITSSLKEYEDTSLSMVPCLAPRDAALPVSTGVLHTSTSSSSSPHSGHECGLWDSALQGLKCLRGGGDGHGVLFDIQKYTHHLEDAYEEMWRALHAGTHRNDIAVSRLAMQSLQ